MARRKVSSHFHKYLGPCREPDTAAEKVLERIYLSTLEGEYDLPDFAPLVAVMHFVTEEIRDFRLSPAGPKGGNAWIEVMTTVQREGTLQHNPRFPCRYCNQAFEPVIDKKLLGMYLAWEGSRSTKDFIAMHRCSACGGTLAAVSPSESYDGDDHTPELPWKGSDRRWMQTILRECYL